jgi:peptide/nickel transport system permease protein
MSAGSASPWRRAAGRFVRDPIAMAAVVYLAIVVVLAVGAPLIASHEPNTQDLEQRFAGPSGDHWLGTDDLGRDTFARLAYGARVSMQMSLSVTALAAVIAVPVGLVAGYRSGTVDVAVMRLTDALMSVPPLVLALAVAGILGPGTGNAVLALTVVAVPGLVRLVRGQTLAVREEGYIDASKAIGTGSLVILTRRVFPHVLSPLIVQLSVMLGTILVVEASLSFLGLGQQLPNASWGGMLRSGFDLMATDARLILVPGIAIAVTTLAFNALGDGLRDALIGGGTRRRRKGDVLGTTSLSPADASTSATRTAQPSEPAASAGASVDAAVVDAPAALVGGDERAGRSDTVLAIRELTVGFDAEGGGVTRVLDGVSLEVRAGEILGLVGESGCGKTVTAQSVLRLLPSPPARILGGEVHFGGRDLLGLPAGELRTVRGREIAMVFQDPMASLNPAFTIGAQIVEAQRVHDRRVSRSAARDRAAELLDLVGIPDARRRLDDFPHTFSGGMRQRALIAMALANEPKLLIADEPTTALDVTVQAQILELIRRLRDALGMAVLFVTHDLGVVQELCDRVAVMYAGQVVETATVGELFASPRHPYTRALLRSRPRLRTKLERLPSIAGVVPSPEAMPEGCRFHERCPHATDACAAGPVPLADVGPGRLVRCLRHAELDDLDDDRQAAREAVGS